MTPRMAAYEEEADAAAVRLFLIPLLADDRVAEGIPREDAVHRTRRRLLELVLVVKRFLGVGIVDAVVQG
jgi:hypothetical protein